MQMGVHGHSHGHGYGHGFGVFGGHGGGGRGWGPGEGRASHGERLVARLDADDDGKLSIAELAESRRGREMSVERFARIDTNGDSMLDAAEIDAMHRGHRGDASREAAMRSRYAAWLAERIEAEKNGDTDVAAEVIRLLDTDQSGRLNSEEIAGTRLAGLIGGDFYKIDADRNGGLDQAELAGLLTEYLTGGEEAEAVVGTDPAPQAAGGAGVTTSPVSSYEQGIQSAFDNALALLESGDTGLTPTEVVQALYAEVKGILQIR